MEASLQIFFRVEFFFPSEWFPPRVRLFMGMETVIFLIEALRKTKISNDYLDIYTITHIHITVNVQLGQAGGQREPPRLVLEV